MLRKPTILRIVSTRRSGLTLIEAVLVLSVVAATTTIVIPAAARMMGSARRVRVQMELNAIAVGMAEYCRDVGYYPGMAPGSFDAGETVLVTDGEFPAQGRSSKTWQWRRARRLPLCRYLRSAEGSPKGRWFGPYLADSFEEDPWDRAYVVNIASAGNALGQHGDRRAIYALSAGPNGIIDTPFDQPASEAEVREDDWAVRLQ